MAFTDDFENLMLLMQQAADAARQQLSELAERDRAHHEERARRVLNELPDKVRDAVLKHAREVVVMPAELHEAPKEFWVARKQPFSGYELHDVVKDSLMRYPETVLCGVSLIVWRVLCAKGPYPTIVGTMNPEGANPHLVASTKIVIDVPEPTKK